MSDIQRFDIRCLAVNKRENGYWVRYDDHRAEVERLTRNNGGLKFSREEAQKDVGALVIQHQQMTTHIEQLTADRNQLRSAMEALIVERDEANALVVRLRLLVRQAQARAEADEITITRLIFDRKVTQDAMNVLISNRQGMLDRSNRNSSISLTCSELTNENTERDEA